MSGDDDILPPYELALNYFTLGGERSPGKCEVRGAGREWEWAELAGWGLDGASLLLRRRVLVEFEIDVKIVTQTELDQWDDFYSKVLQTPAYHAGKKSSSSPFTNAVQAVGGAGFGAPATPGKSTTASRGLGIYHPRLARLGIGSAVVKKVGQFNPTKGGGEMVTIYFKEYRAPKFVLTKPNGLIPAAGKPQPRAKDALDAAIETETQRVHALTVADNAAGSLL